jgi:hypothetical protein
MTRWERLGAVIGDALGRVLDPLVGDRLRASYAAHFGVCRTCCAPLCGPSPSQLCSGCHAAHALAAGLGGGPTADA